MAAALVAVTGLPLCGIAQVVGSAPEAVTKIDLATEYGTAVAPIRADRPAITDEDITQMKRIGQDMILADVIARGPAVERGRTPNYNYVRGQAVPKRLRGDEIGLRMQIVGAPEDVIRAGVDAAKASGLLVAPEGHWAINDWVVVKLVNPAANADAMYAMIENVIKVQGVRVAVPVFHNAFINGGFYMPTDEVLARVKEGADVDATLRAQAHGFEVSDPKLGGIERAVTLRSSLRNGFEILRRANELQESGEFEWSTPATLETMEQHVVTPSDPLFIDNQWVHRNTGLDWYSGGSLIYNGDPDFDMDTDQAWDITRGKSTVGVLILDSGIQVNQPELNWANGRDFTTGAASGVGDGSPGNSCDNHGTAVAGCSAAFHNTVGVAGTSGLGTVYSGKIGTQVVPCGTTFSAYSNAWLVNALNWGRSQGIKVTNASIGVSQDSAVETAYTDGWNAGQLHFASAGNSSSNGSGFPGSAPYTVSVIAVDVDGTISSFSNWGVNCDLCAGGTFVLTTDRTSTAGYNNTSGTAGDTTWFSGTSAASPLAAGVGMLFFSQHGFATPSQARTAIFNSCVDVGTAGIDATYQRGHINAFGALTENAPINDDVNTPNVISPNGGNVVYRWVQDTTWATPSRLEPDPTCTGTDQNSVFFRFTADHDGTVTAHTSGSSYDTVLAAFDGAPTFDSAGVLLTSPNQYACNDDFSGSTSQITFAIKAGQTALIRASKYGSTAGGGTLDFNFAFNYAVPANDACSAAVVISDTESGDFTFEPAPYDVHFATTASCEPDESCGSTTNSRSVFYKFVPAHDGLINIDTVGSSYDTVLSVHSGCGLTYFIPPSSFGCIQPTQYACDDDSGPGLLSSIQSLPVSAGATYIIEVSTWGTSAANVARILDFNFAYFGTVPSNDHCDSAIVIPGANTSGGITNYSDSMDVYYTDSSYCDPTAPCVSAGFGPRHTVWYSFTPAMNGAINLSTSGSGYDTVLTVQAGCRYLSNFFCFGPTAQYGCNDNISTTNLGSQMLGMPVVAGTTYYFMVAAKSEMTPVSDSILDFYLQYAADVCPADYNGDGAVDGDDVISFFAAWDAADPGADVTGDGSVDGDDVISFFSAWDSGC